ncbi:hypothetical protein VCRA2119O430_280037 [Vibrio crassostreae]|nr:hypothetical protein VCRA2119O431_10502 [Vibrio crassostreae]CAK1875418.1 hypothetical protein VCRA2113O409_10502 [Vibrio crassostreae]CAK1886976.1 hypothetical protein VCRA2113O414_10502 [Vibrio crassostreae]CAK1945352.1 hypothetical protein VCRA2118O429_260036 [Vibrio crassostreae]CAK1957166.1 hypothetical protein VCRA2119O430_280037 [Vibrio crassostreae]
MLYAHCYLHGDDDGQTTGMRYGTETTNNGDEPIRKEWI